MFSSVSEAAGRVCVCVCPGPLHESLQCVCVCVCCASASFQLYCLGKLLTPKHTHAQRSSERRVCGGRVGGSRFTAILIRRGEQYATSRTSTHEDKSEALVKRCALSLLLNCRI